MCSAIKKSWKVSNTYSESWHLTSIKEIFKDSHSISKKDHTLAFSMRCMTDHHLKLCRQGCKFCISSLASNGERKKIPFPPFLKCLWCSPHPGEFLVPAQPLERKTRPKRDRMLHVPSPLNEQWGGRTTTMYYTFFRYKGYQPRQSAHREWSQCLNITKEHCTVPARSFYSFFYSGKNKQLRYWGIPWTFWQRGPSDIMSWCRKHPGCQNVPMSKCPHAETYMVPKCPSAPTRGLHAIMSTVRPWDNR